MKFIFFKLSLTKISNTLNFKKTEHKSLLDMTNKLNY